MLYFENQSGAKEDEYFRDGITEDIVTELSKIKKLEIFPRSEMLAFRDKPVTAHQVGQQLGAAYVLEGSIRRAGNRVRITAQLVEASTRHSVWAERYDRQLEDVFAIQEEIARSIAQALRITLTPQEETDHRAQADGKPAGLRLLPPRPELRAPREHGLRPADVRAGHPARPEFRPGARRDRPHLRAHLPAPRAEPEVARTGEWPPATGRRPSRPTCRRFSSRALASSTRRRNTTRRAILAQRAIERKPDCDGSWNILGRAYFASGRFEDAAALTERAIEANGDDYNTYVPYVHALQRLGRKNEAEKLRKRMVKVLRQQLELVPEDVRARDPACHATSPLSHEDQDEMHPAPADRRRPSPRRFQHALQRRLHLRRPREEGRGARNGQEGVCGRIRQPELGGQRHRPRLPARRPGISEAGRQRR